MKQQQLHETVNCLNCDKIIASFIDDKMSPAPQECYQSGNVPVPNCGWFCSQACVTEFGTKHNLKFSRHADGMVDYYRDDFK